MNTKIESIHNASMTILEEIGIRLLHPEILELVAGKGIRVTEDRAYFRRDVLMDWVKRAPRRFTLFARNPAHDSLIGSTARQFAAGYGCPQIIAADGTRRNACLSDYFHFLKLVHQSPLFRINGGLLVQPDDLPPSQSHAALTYLALCYSDKGILGIPGTADQVQLIMNLAGIVFGGAAGLSAKPRVLTLVNTLSPLRIDTNTLDTMRVCARYRQPVIISPGPMAGATGPVTLAGNIALGNAEALAAIAICQMLQDGTPVVYGMQATTTDMRTGGVCIGSPGVALQSAYTAELARSYGLPSRGGGASTDAPEISVQSGYESMLAMLVACQSRINLIMHAAGVLNSYAAMSYEQFIADLEIMEMIDYYLQDVTVDKETLALETIRAAGPGGEFLTQPHTMTHCRKTTWLSSIGIIGGRSQSKTTGGILARIKTQEAGLLSAYQQPRLPVEMQKRLDAYLAELDIDADRLRDNSHGFHDDGDTTVRS